MRAPHRSGLVGLLLLAGACDDVDTRAETAGLPSTYDAVKAHEWVLDRGASTPSPGEAGRAVTLAIADGTATGTGPCNGFRADAAITGDDIEISGIVQTLRSCGDTVDRAETEHFAALERVTTVDLDDDDERLVLTGREGVRLVYDAYDADEAIVGEWHVVDVAADGDDTLASVPSGVDPVLAFDASGDVSVTGLCNTIASRWTLDGTRLTIDPPLATLMACDPAELMETESLIAAALERTDRVTITPDTLTGHDSAGAIVLVAVAGTT